MVYNVVDPAHLDGDELTRWYQRSPQEIEDERQAAAASATFAAAISAAVPVGLNQIHPGGRAFIAARPFG